MSDDVRAVALAIAVALGALHPSRPALIAGAGLVLLGVAGRWAGVIVVGMALVAAGLAQRSLDGLDGLRAEAVRAPITLLSDPAPSGGGLRFDARLGHRRVEVRARGSTEAAVRDALAGEVLTVRGHTTPASASAPWLVPRHVAGELDLVAVIDHRPGSAPARLANALRRTLDRGAEPLALRERSLYTGLVIGDDRNQPADLADDFLGAGLTHLLAVSGQNVAFVLAVAGPVLRRLRLWPRLGLTLVVIAGFALATRFEPSVLRASMMAAVASTVATAGWPWPRVRVLAVASTVLLLVDPLLARAVGFRLSVAAAVAIVTLAPLIERALPGPSWWREPMAVTLAAQLGVAPVLVATFGPVPVASLPANLLAVPIAGFVMVWGLSAGLAAGALGGLVRAIALAPTRASLAALEQVAHRSALAPLGSLGVPHLVALAAGLLLAATLRRPWRGVGRALAGAGVLAAILAAHAPAPLRTEVAPGVIRWSHAATDVVVLRSIGRGRGPSPDAALDGLRRSGVRSIDLLVVADESVSAELVALVARGRPLGRVIARHLDGPVAAPVDPPPDGRAVVDVGGLTVRLDVLPERIVVDAVPRGPPATAR